MRQIDSEFRRRIVLALGALAFARGASGASDVDEKRTGGEYVPTPPVVVGAMLKLANVGPNDYVIDLGSGDGRIVLQAATQYKAGGLGVDIDPELVRRANASARKLGVADRVQFKVQDVLVADISRATVVTLYLLPPMMMRLHKKLLAELKPGTRIVSHDNTFYLDVWKPDRTITVKTQEKFGKKKSGKTGSWTSDVHLWIVPSAQVAK